MLAAWTVIAAADHRALLDYSIHACTSIAESAHARSVFRPWCEKAPQVLCSAIHVSKAVRRCHPSIADVRLNVDGTC